MMALPDAVVDYVLVLSWCPSSIPRAHLPPFRTTGTRPGYRSESDAKRRAEQVCRQCRQRYGTEPRFSVVKRERRVRRRI